MIFHYLYLRIGEVRSKFCGFCRKQSDEMDDGGRSLFSFRGADLQEWGTIWAKNKKITEENYPISNILSKFAG